jgi:hypothetical protein
MIQPHQDRPWPAALKLVGQKAERESRDLEKCLKPIWNVFPVYRRTS